MIETPGQNNGRERTAGGMQTLASSQRLLLQNEKGPRHRIMAAHKEAKYASVHRI